MTIAEAMAMGSSHLQAGRLDQAEEIFRAILAKQADNPYALNYLGVILAKRGQESEAASLMRRSVSGNPPVAHLYTNLAGVLLSIRDMAGAEAAARAGLALEPNMAQGRLDLGNALWAQGKLEEAVSEFRKGVESDPRRWDIYGALGLCLGELGRIDESLDALQKVVELEPRRATNLATLGNAQLSAGRVEQAIENCRKAVELVPNEPGAHYNLAIALLTAGNWTSGWEEYEWRLQDLRLTPEPRVYIQPAWEGSLPQGKTLLLYTEETPADAIMFARYIPSLAERRAKILLECQPELMELLRSVPGVDQVFARGEMLPEFDFHLPLGSLPKIFGTTPQNVPAPGAYLHPPKDRIESARERIAQSAGDARLKVGISWIASNRPTQQWRNLGIQSLAALGEVAGVRWYNLGPVSVAKHTLGGAEIVDLFRSFRDFADVAAAVANLDLVITADTMVPHIAGAMGKEIWLLLPFASDWRWLRDGDDTPWYPTVRLFRQPTPGDWGTPISRVIESLKQRGHAG